MKKKWQLHVSKSGWKHVVGLRQSTAGKKQVTLSGGEMGEVYGIRYYLV